jgi:trk system potassium uptake protein TrkH
MALLMLVPAFVAAIYKEPSGVVALGLTSLVTLASGLTMRHYGQEGEVMHREAFVIVTFGWLLATAFSSLPFIFLGMGAVDALFETMSGYTTTGATILTESNAQGYWVLNSTAAASSLAYSLVNSVLNPLSSHLVTSGAESALSIRGTFYGLLFWGLHQLLSAWHCTPLLAILPQLGVAGRQLYYVETSREPLTPRVKNTAKIFWGIYLAFVALETLVLWAAGLPFYDSICTSFTTISTAGYSPLSAGIAAYDSLLVEVIVAIFMIIGAPASSSTISSSTRETSPAM